MGRYYPDRCGEAKVVERHPPVGYASEVVKHDGFIPKVIGSVGIVGVFKKPKQGMLVGYGLKVFVREEGDEGFRLKEVASGLVGEALRITVGVMVGVGVGACVGSATGCEEGTGVAATVGFWLGWKLGADVTEMGRRVGREEGLLDGALVGWVVPIGLRVGAACVGGTLEMGVGRAEGC